MTCFMCNPWKRTSTLVPLAPLIVFSPKSIIVVRKENNTSTITIINNCIDYNDVVFDVQSCQLLHETWKEFSTLFKSSNVIS
jgi:hypothetical protein